MKSIKALGLPILGALLLLICLGGSTASATILCETNTDPCTGEGYPAGTAVEASLASGTKAILSTAFATVECTTSSVKGEIENGGGEPEAVVSGPITTLSFSGCSCAITTLKTGSLEVSWTSGANGTLTGKNIEITANCSGLASCKFGATSATMGPVTGGESATIDVEATLSYISGDASSFICTGGTGLGTLTASYTVNAPAPLYVVQSKVPNIIVRVPGGLPKLIFTKAGETKKLEVENISKYDAGLGQQSIYKTENDFKIIGGDCKSPGTLPAGKDKDGNTKAGTKHVCIVEIKWESGNKATATYTMPFGVSGSGYLAKKDIES